MKQLAEKFIFQSIVIWTCMFISTIFDIIFNKNYLIGSICLLCNVLLLADAISASKKFKILSRRD